MLLDQRSFPGLAIASRLVPDELTAEAAEIDAARDMAEYLGFSRDRGLQICRTHVAHLRADFVGGTSERKSRFKDQPVHSTISGGAEVRFAFEDDMDWEGDEVHVSSMRLKALHTTGLTLEEGSVQGCRPGMH